MRRRIVGGTLVIMLVVLACLEIPIGLLFSGARRDTFEARVRADAYAIALSVTSATDTASIGPRVKVVRLDADARVVVVDRSGIVQFDSDPIATDGATGSGGVGRNFSNRSEISGALRGNEQVLSRESKTLGTSLFIVAVPIVRAGRADGVVRISMPSSDVDAAVRTTWLILLALALGVLTIVVPMAWVWSGRVSSPIHQLAERFAALGAGDLTTRAGVPRDPPELKQLAQNFNTMAAQLEQSMKSQGQFAADAAHELRTPLAALRLRLEALQDAAKDTPDHDLDAAVRETQRLGNIINGLLALSRPQAPGTQEQVQLLPLVQERARYWGPLAAEHSVTCTVRGASEALIEASPARLTQIFDNLIDNALSFAPDSSALRLSVDVNEQHQVVARIEDEGPGVPPEMQERIFDRFWRAAGQERAGSGLGLAIVRMLVEIDGGTIRAMSAPGGGLAVEIVWPASTPTAEAPAGD